LNVRMGGPSLRKNPKNTRRLETFGGQERMDGVLHQAKMGESTGVRKGLRNKTQKMEKQGARGSKKSNHNGLSVGIRE